MTLLDHYTRLLQCVDGSDHYSTIEISLSDIADILCCTNRNVNFVLKQMEEMDWVQWHPGRGRGNKSKLSFRINRSELILRQCQELVEKGHIKSAIDRINKDDIEQPYKLKFYESLYPLFGYQTGTSVKVDGDTLRFPFYRTIPELDPAYVTRRTEAHMVNQIFDTLVSLNHETGEMNPHLAFHWEIDLSGLEWTFFLRKGVEFHHGRDLNAGDVAFTINRLRTLNHSPYRWMFDSIEEINVLSSKVIQFHLKRPNRMFLHFLGSTAASIVPQDAVQSDENGFARLPVGTGPFRLIRNDESMFILEAHDYFKERAHLDRIELWVIPDLHENRFSVNPPNVNFFPYHAFKVLPPDNQWKGLEQIEQGCKYIVINGNRTFGKNKDARLALFSMIDRQRMMEELGENRVKIANGFLLSDNEAQKKSSSPKDLKIDTGTLKLYTYDMLSNRLEAEWIKKQCSRFGVYIDVTVLSIKELYLRMQEADIILTGEVLNEDTELSLLSIYLNENSFVANGLEKKNREKFVDEVKRIMELPNKEKRLAELRQIECKLQKEGVIFFLFHLRQSSFFLESLRGASLNAFGQLPFKDLWFYEKH